MSLLLVVAPNHCPRATARYRARGSSSLESRACWCQRNVAFEDHVSRGSRSYQEAARQEDPISHRTRVSASKASSSQLMSHRVVVAVLEPTKCRGAGLLLLVSLSLKLAAGDLVVVSRGRQLIVWRTVVVTSCLVTAPGNVSSSSRGIIAAPESSMPDQ